MTPTRETEGHPMPRPARPMTTRRAFLRGAAGGLGAIALQLLLRRDLGATAPGRGVVNPLHHAARAKRVIYLYMAGGPSHLETFDPKPELARMHGRPIPASVTRGQPLSPLNRSTNLCVAPQTGFRRCGRSGQVIA